MGIICVCDASPSSGATTLALALAVTMPGPATTVLIEADPAGGTLAHSFQIAPEPTLSHVPNLDPTAAGSTVDSLRQLPIGLPAWLCPTNPIDAWTAVTLMARSHLADALQRDHVVVVDVGHLTESSPVSPIVSRGNLTLIVARAHPDCAADIAAAAATIQQSSDAAIAVVIRTAGCPGFPTGWRPPLGLDATAVREDRLGAKLLRNRTLPDLYWQCIPLARDARRIAVDTIYRIPTVLPPLHSDPPVHQPTARLATAQPHRPAAVRALGRWPMPPPPAPRGTCYRSDTRVSCSAATSLGPGTLASTSHETNTGPNSAAK